MQAISFSARSDALYDAFAQLGEARGAAAPANAAQPSAVGWPLCLFTKSANIAIGLLRRSSGRRWR